MTADLSAPGARRGSGPAAGNDGVVLVTATAPTPNGPLHLGHLSGPYIAGDIAARALRASGRQVLTVSGLDPHQNYVLAKAEQLGEPVDQVLERYQGQVSHALAAARVDYDVFVRPRSDADYRRAVADLLAELVTGKAAVVTEVELAACAGCGRTLHHGYVTGRCALCGQASGGGTCEGCGSFTTGSTLRETRCASCGGPPRPLLAEIPVLKLEEYRDRLTAIWARATLPARVRQLLGHYLTHGLPEVPLAYPTDWGIPVEAGIPGDGAQARASGQPPAGGRPRVSQQLRLDVWVEMGLGYLYAVAHELAPGARGAEDYVTAWAGVSDSWHFLGIDNAFYFAVLFPALFAAVGMPEGTLGGLVVNEFYRLDGLKFSTSRNHAVWAHEFLADEDAGLARLYLCWDRPDRYESDFTREGFRAFQDWFASLRTQPAAVLPPVLVEQNLERAERALQPAHFDPALALRCLLPVLAAGDQRADAQLAVLTGTPPGVPTRPGAAR